MSTCDRRIVRTKMAIRYALLDLLKRKDLTQITVKEICTQANINRNTFYAHYKSLADVLQEIEVSYYEKIQKLQNDAIKNGDVEALLLGSMNLLLENKDYAVVFYGKYYDSSRIEHFAQAMYSSTINTWLKSSSRDKADSLEWHLLFLAGGISKLLHTWVINGMKEDPKTLACLASKMCAACSEAVFHNI